jgi:hypothetical protein
VEKTMNDSTHATAVCIYALPEESFQTLHELRNLMFLMATTTHVVSMEEKTIHLRLPRAMLSQCFRHVGVQLAEVLDAVEQFGGIDDGSLRKH